MTALLDAAGRRRSPVTMPGYHAGRPPGNKGMHYPADPPTVPRCDAFWGRAARDNATRHTTDRRAHQVRRGAHEGARHGASVRGFA